MSCAKHRTRAALTLGFLCTIQLMTGCMAASVLKGKPGVNVGALKAGLSRTEAEEILGPPVREWTTSSGIRYRVYVYDAGVPPSTGDAAVVAFLDLLSGGLGELVWAFKPPPEGRVREQMAVSYDSRDVVVGVFDRFGDLTELPPDGRPLK